MAGKEYAHEIGRMLEGCDSSEQRVAIARLLAATGCSDAIPYLLEAIAEETDEAAAIAIRGALATLGATA